MDSGRSSPVVSMAPQTARRRLRLTCRRLDKLCCRVMGYFPLAFVYAISSWAAYTEVISISFRTVRGARGAPLPPSPPLLHR